LAKIVKIDQSETEVLKCHNTQQNQPLKDYISSPASISKKHILIADNVENPDKLTNSKDIRKRIQENIPQTKVHLTYRLPLSGVALHFEKEEDKTYFENCDTTSIFGQNSVLHKPRTEFENHNKEGFLKDIQSNIDLNLLKDNIEQQSKTQILSINRLRYWDTKTFMPIVKITFNSPSELQKALNIKSFIYMNEDKEFHLEEKRNYKITRCYNCHSFGHCSRICTNKRKCINCGSEDCVLENCNKKSTCCNCGENHKASSSKCQVFKKVLNQKKFAHSM
jgi:hypothetical protein